MKDSNIKKDFTNNINSTDNVIKNLDNTYTNKYYFLKKLNSNRILDKNNRRNNNKKISLYEYEF